MNLLNIRLTGRVREQESHIYYLYVNFNCCRSKRWFLLSVRIRRLSSCQMHVCSYVLEFENEHQIIDVFFSRKDRSAIYGIFRMFGSEESVCLYSV